MRIDTFGSGIVFLLMSLGCILGAQLYDYPPGRVFIYCCAGLFLVFSLSYLRYLVIADDGINHKFFGIRYRFTSWENVKDIMRVLHPSEKGGVNVLPVTTVNGQIYRPNERGHVPKEAQLEKRFFAEWLSGKLFVVRLPQHPKGAEDKVAQYVADRYGPLDYDAFSGLNDSGRP